MLKPATGDKAESQDGGQPCELAADVRDALECARRAPTLCSESVGYSAPRLGKTAEGTDRTSSRPRVRIELCFGEWWIGIARSLATASRVEKHGS
jgi:hypothetical protein